MSIPQPAETDHQLAARLATETGRLLVELRAGAARRDRAEPGQSALRDRADRTAHQFLMAELARHRPADGVLSEEASADDPPQPGRLRSERVWIVDPLDGTREFGEPPRSDWAVHVALAVGGTPVAGAVALPAQGRTLATEPPPVLPSTPPPGGRPRVVVSRTRPPASALAVADALGADLVPLGSAGAKAMAVVTGEAEVYVHSGGQYEWDSCAPVAVAAAAGLHTSRLDGSPLVYNQPDPWLPDLVICRPELAASVIEAARLVED